MKSALETSSSSTFSEMVDLEDQRKMSVFGRDKNVQVDWKDLTGNYFNLLFMIGFWRHHLFLIL